MNIFLEDSELEEIKPLEDKTDDHALVINPTVGKRGEENSDLQKELVALDSLILGPSAAAELHGVAQSSASKYSNGKDVPPEIRTNVLATKHGIEDLAVAKLMDTLNLINPSDLEKPRDKIALLSGLSSLVDKISGKDREGNKTVHLHLYGPNQKKEQDYDVIEA